jgi:hypothetical protein
MTHSNTTRRSTLKRALICAAAAATALAASASPALADGFSLKLTAPSPAVVGHPLILHGDGTVPLDELDIPYWFSLVAIPPSVTPTCPEDMWEGVQFAKDAGGATIVLQQREVTDSTGHFSVPVAVTPSSPGSVLLCAYTDDALTTTLARSQLLLAIQGGSSAPAHPRAPSPPVQATRDIRACLALLGPRQGKSCIRHAVKRANVRCRHYHGHRKQARCLRAVRRVAKRHA